MRAYTDMPIRELGDFSGKPAPVREVEVVSYDGNKYCHVRIQKLDLEIKAGYLYTQPGRCGEVPPLTRRQLALLAPADQGGA